MRYRQAIFSTYRSLGYAQDYLDDAKGKASIAARYAEEFGAFLPPDKGARILDLGCGGGYLVRWLIEKGYRNVHGVDFSEEQVAYASQQLGLPVTQGDCHAYLAHHGDFDLIISTDVIEHQHKDEVIDFLTAIHRALAPGGRVILRTGNMSSMYGPTIRYIDFTHETGFTEFSMKQVLLATGFDNVTITDSKVPFGLKPKRFARWALCRLWRRLWQLAFTLEVGEDRPRLLGKLLIGSARKPVATH